MSDDIPEAGEELTEDETHTRVVDVSRALHMAGHEVEELGLEDVPDIGGVLHEEDDDAGAGYESHVEADIATRGQGH